jgi:hypothetical protein
MSNEKRGAVFRQSIQDFPLTVNLGEKEPSWGLARWGGKGLRFIPPAEEGFTLRADKQRLEYKGRRRSHRFSILGDTAFEYDCILEREPDSNVVSLYMVGAEDFDFYRQPDFVTDPFLKGSIAVYKKVPALGEGTGKLCHINRPEIIDARGRRCWGDLAVKLNMLRITIPEDWLSEAAYPVVVDPVIGTTTVGSQNSVLEDDGEYYPQYLDSNMAVSRFLVPDGIKGICTACFYTDEDDYEAGGMAILYSDNLDIPDRRRSRNEQFINFRVTGSMPKGWRSGTFEASESIGSGSYIWFGAYAYSFWYYRFDYGGKCYFTDWDWNNPGVVPEIFLGKWGRYSDGIKISMYFDYTPAQDYVRVLTQGVTLSDKRTLKGNYKRKMTQTAGAASLLGRFKGFYRLIKEAVIGTAHSTSPVLFLRSVVEKIKINDTVGRIQVFYRSVFDYAQADGEARAGPIQFTKIADAVQAAGAVFRGLVLIVRIVTGVFIRDYLLMRFLKARSELVLRSAITREIILESRIY